MRGHIGGRRQRRRCDRLHQRRGGGRSGRGGRVEVRERLRLAYGDAAAFSIVANFPRGVAATIIVPAAAAIAPAAGAARA